MGYGAVAHAGKPSHRDFARPTELWRPFLHPAHMRHQAAQPFGSHYVKLPLSSRGCKIARNAPMAGSRAILIIPFACLPLPRLERLIAVYPQPYL
jgi:hypothetical protein